MGTLLVVLAAVAVAAAAAHLLILRIAERRIRDGLTREGGEAEVEIAALPALRLLWRAGDRLVVRGRGLRIGMSREGGGLGALDGFAEVEIELRDFVTGPFEVAEMRLVRRGSAPYLMEVRALTSGGSLLGFGSTSMSGPGAPVLGLLARAAPLGDRRLRVSVEVELTSEEG